MAIFSTGDTLIGGTENDVLLGNSNANTLDGGLGADSMIGYAGNDTYYVDNTGDVVTENAGAAEGTDTVISSIDYTLAANVEGLTLAGSALKATGNSIANTITGNSLNNTLDAVGTDTTTGTDTLAGGLGDDTYIVDSSSDVVNETASDGGIDIILSSATRSISTTVNIEDLTLTGTALINATGNTQANILTGNAAKNSLTGATGNDTYYVQNTDDVVIETSALTTEIDTVSSSVSYDISSNGDAVITNDYVENLTLTGSDAINGIGNSLANILTGNSGANSLDGAAGVDNLVGASGNDTLNGGTGDDVLTGGIGDDTYVIDSAGDVITETDGEGNDTVSTTANYSLGTASIENITLTASGLTATGNTVANILTSTTGGNTLAGGAGNDTYRVSTTTDTINELSGAGTDTIESSVTSYALSTSGANRYVENLTLTGSSNIDATGNDLTNVLTGNSGNNTLDGKTGADSMSGGLGNDTYYVDNTGDAVSEGTSDGGNDTVVTSIDYELGNNLEALTLATGIASINGTGNSLDNVLTGNSGDNSLSGSAGYDTLNGDAGNDTLNGGTDSDTMDGGLGNDTYVIDNIDDIIQGESNPSTSQIDTVESSLTYTLASTVTGSYVENLTLTGTNAISGTGNELDNILTGNEATNTLTGGAGMDTYVVQSTSDVVLEYSADANIDTINAAVSYVLSTNATTGFVENLVLTGTDAISGTGNSLNNYLEGNTANNTLDGGAGNDEIFGGLGNDSMIGGDGSDYYYVDSSSDVVTETSTSTSDIDEVESSVNYSLAANVENLYLIGTTATDALNGTGNSLANELDGNNGANSLAGGVGADSIYASAGDDILDGGLDADSMDGGTGSDSYAVDNTGDIIDDTSPSISDVDTVNSSISYTLASTTSGDYLENLTLTGTSTINATGNESNNIIIGNSANNSIDGGAGVDILKGAAGNDTYAVDSATDIIIENDGEGSDTVVSSVNYTLADTYVEGTLTLNTYVENLTLAGMIATLATGNALNNVLLGNTLANTLDGGLGADNMNGGLANDTYIVDNTGDVVSEGTADNGNDTVNSSVDFTLASNLENLALTGTTGTEALNGTGNSQDNVLTGNSGANSLAGADGNDVLNGGDGNDSLNGGAGSDAMSGGAGDDTYYVDASFDTITEAGGIDEVISTVNYTLSDATLENLKLTGTATNGFGNAAANRLTANPALASILTGGDGNDTYVVYSSSDQIREDSTVSTEIDTVESVVSYSLNVSSAAYVENLTLVGSANINATGNTSANKLTGNAGNNILDGGVGFDNMVGGLGDDTYVVDYATEAVTENAGEGTDKIKSSVSYTLLDNFENLELTGTAPNGTGNSVANNIVGNSVANSLFGSDGNDALSGAAGNDKLSGDVGADTLNGGDGNDTLNGGIGTDVMNGNAGNDLYYVNLSTDKVNELAAAGTDTVYSPINYTLGNNVENLVLTGTNTLTGTGNALPNSLTGNNAANTLNGGLGADTLTGGQGADTYYVDVAGDKVVELAGAGIDKVQSTVSYILANNVETLILAGTSAINGIGNTLPNILTGNAAANVLNGSGGADTLTGGAGNDTYVIDNIGDKVNENAAAGIDTVQSSLSYALLNNVENLTLTGTAAINATGNSVGNVLIGNAAANILNGGLGVDNMQGLAGNDTYYVNVLTDKVTEALNAGSDTVNSAINYTLGGNVEKLVLLGAALLNGTGNELPNTLTGNTANNLLQGLGANDTLNGGAGNDILNGGVGVDTLIGGLGNDVYLVDNVSDNVIENAGQGTDTINSSVSYTIKNNVENMTLTGAAAINGTGNTLNNTLTGNAAANKLSGGLGLDSLDGGLGNDTLDGGAAKDLLIGGAGTDVLTGGTEQDIFKLTSLAGYDKLVDFSSVDDTIQLENAVFTAFTTTGAIPAGSLRSGAGFTTAADSNDYLIYNTTTGALYYDADGSGAAKTAVQIALIGTAALGGVAPADFVIV